MKRQFVFIIILFIPLIVYPQTEWGKDVQKLIDRAVEQILTTQASDGTWSYEGVYRVNGKIPIGYQIGGTAIVSQMLLYSKTKHAKETNSALSKGIDFILRALKDPRMKPSTVDTYDVRIWGHTYALILFCRLRAAHQKITPEQSKKIGGWIPTLVKALITEELSQGGWNYANRRQPATFVTAPVIQALIWAKSQGEEVPDAVLERAHDYLLDARHASGAFEYAGRKNTYDKEERSMLPGSIARSAVCESTLHLLGAGAPQSIQNAIDAFHKHWDELEKRRKKTGTHAPPYGIAPYYFYYGHYYAAQAIELLPQSSRPRERSRLKDLILQTRDSDGTWNDRVFPKSRSYGTAMAIMSLIANRIPLPPELSLKEDNR